LPCPQLRYIAQFWPKMQLKPRSKTIKKSTQVDMAVTLTSQAAEHIGKYLQKRGKGIGLRLGVRTTGCSGMAYKLEYVDEAVDDDQIFESFGVKVFVDPKSLSYLDGTELDYAREGLNEGFKFRNPNEKATCGCGESFTV
jgi:iron-sulfur cluster assembly protein